MSGELKGDLKGTYKSGHWKTAWMTVVAGWGQFGGTDRLLHGGPQARVERYPTPYARLNIGGFLIFSKFEVRAPSDEYFSQLHCNSRRLRDDPDRKQ